MSSSVWDGRRFCCSSQAASSTFLHQRYQSGGEQQRLLFPRGTPVLLVMKAMQLPAVTTHVDESKVALETYPEPTQASMRLVFGCQPLPLSSQEEAFFRPIRIFSPDGTVFLLVPLFLRHAPLLRAGWAATLCSMASLLVGRWTGGARQYTPVYFL